MLLCNAVNYLTQDSFYKIPFKRFAVPTPYINIDPYYPLEFGREGQMEKKYALVYDRHKRFSQMVEA